MSSELEITFNMLKRAEFPEDIFGALTAPDGDGKRAQLMVVYRQLVKVLHPDRYQQHPASFELAQQAFPLLTTLFDRAKARIEQQIYGTRTQEQQDDNEVDLVITTKAREYHLRTSIAEGDLSIIYGGDFVDENGATVPIVAKVIKDSADNDLAQNEARVLKMLVSGETKYSKHLPKFYDQFKTTDGQMGLIISRLDGYDLYSVREKYKDGVPERHMVWMLRRLLSIAGFAHSRAIIHGNIEPAHLMIRPKDHNLFLIDWSYAAVNPFHSSDGFKVLNEEYSAPEVAERKKPIPASDLYSIGKCMIYLLGGDVKTNSIPTKVNEKLRRFIQYLTLPSPLQRAQDAWEAHKFLGKLSVELWGPRTFIEFEM